jgi:hypothetical protein
LENVTLTARPSQAPTHLNWSRVLPMLLLEPFTGWVIMSRADSLEDKGKRENKKTLASNMPKVDQRLLNFTDARMLSKNHHTTMVDHSKFSR